MKYFTPKLWIDLNSSKYSVRKKAVQQCDQNMKSYQRHLLKILPRLNRKARMFFDKENLHDGDPLLFSISELLIFYKRAVNSKANFIEIKVLHPESNDLYILFYSLIRNFSIHFPNDNSLFRDKQCIFGKWGYDELSMTKDKWLKHEILLDSGATVIIEFKKFTYTIRRLKGKGEIRKTIRQISSRTY